MRTSGERIRTQREKKGLLLRQLAAQLDIDTAILSKIERGERKATKEQITNIAVVLGIDLESIMIQYLSEKILYEIQDDELGLKALKIAEKTILYKKSKLKV